MFYFGNFKYLMDQDHPDEKERRHGSFSMMVQTASSEEALNLFRLRLNSFRESTSLFTGECLIYINQLLEFEKFPEEEAVLLDLKSFAGDPTMPYISCVAPTEQSNACTIHHWDKNLPVTENQGDSLFLVFKS